MIMQNHDIDEQKTLENITFSEENIIGFEYGGHRIKFLEDNQDWIPKLIKKNKSFYELELLTRIKEYLVPGDIALDVGANIGNHSVYLAKICQCKVFSFEAITDNFVKLKKNVELNQITDLVECFNFALGANKGLGKFILPASSNFGSYKLVHTDIEEDRTIAILKLDEVNLNLNDKKIKFIKLDIEGMEYDALLGALMIIKRDKPLLSIEIKTNQEFYKIYDLLLPLKYSVIGTFNATPTFLFAPEENAGDINALRKTIRELSVYYIQSKTLLKNNPSNVLSESVLSKEKQDQTFVCPLCNYHGIFHDFGYKKRNNALCPNCGSLERTRLLFLFLDKYLDLFKRKMKVIHFAPENNLYKIFMEKIGKLYYPVDIDPELYNKLNMKVDRVDMCSDLDEIYLEKFDIVLHIHVLEHIKCNYRVTLHKIHQLMKPGCVHIIAVPFGGQKTIEDLSPNLIPEERIRRFGHPDHMRSFGEEDFVKVLQEVSGFNNVECDYDKFLTKDDIVKYSLGFDTQGNIPRWNRLFYYIKK
jgi:FkbM family methyltransferase